MSHTPGPWDTIHETAGYITVTGPSGFGLAEVDARDIFKQGWDGEANARLIASAPDLLNAISGVVLGDIKSTPDGNQLLVLTAQTWDAVRMAFAKATVQA